MSGLSQRLAAFITSADVDTECRDRAATTLATTAERATAGRTDAEVTRLIEALDAVEGGVATPLGQSETRSVPAAALVSAVSADRAAPGDEDDARAATAVCAAATAAAQAGRATGPELLDAIAVGVEVATRVGAGLATSGYAESGWDPVGATGSIGAAAAVARLAGSDEATVRQALGVAATQAAGLAVADGTSTWSLHVGKAAANGVEAALLCHAGFSGPPAGIEGRRGLLAVAAPGSDVARVLDGLGEVWRTSAPPLSEARRGTLHELVGALARSEATVDDLIVSCTNG